VHPAARILYEMERWRGQFVCGFLSALLVAGAAGCRDESEGGAGGSGNGFSLEYTAGANMLLDLQVTASLSFTGTKPNIPSMRTVGVAQAHAIVRGDGQQGIQLKMSSSPDSLDEGDRFDLYLEFSRANQGGVIDGGGTLSGVLCNVAWFGADDSAVGVPGECDIRRSGGGYVVIPTTSYDETTGLTGTVTFGPVPNEIAAFTPGGGCDPDQICLSLDPSEFEPDVGYCLPATNLAEQAKSCSASCAEQLEFTVGGSPRCICTSACGGIGGGGGGDPPVCDPAYGCIDF
jgi:hypothetical protein